MTLSIIIVFLLVIFWLVLRFITLKMYALTPNKHSDTPEEYGIGYTEIRFPTENNRSLYGWWIPAENQSESAPTLVLVHGWGRNLGRMLRYIQHLHPFGYNLLAFDARHHGSSDQDDHASMYKFGRDVKAAVQHIQTLEVDSNRIGVIGLSIGGAGSTYAASIEPGIRAVVTVGAPAHPVDVMVHEFKKHHLPRFVRWLILKQIEMKIGIKYAVFAPVMNIAKADAAFMVIHGASDQVVLPSQGEKLKEAARPGQCEYWPIAERGHSNCHHEPGFWERLDDFFQAQLKEG